MTKEELEKRIQVLELKIKHLTEHLEPQTMTALFEQVEEEVKQEQRIEKLEKENAELKEKVSFLEDNLRVARKDRENLQLNVAKGLKEFVKDCPATSLRYLTNEKYVERFDKAKEIIKYLLSFIQKENYRTRWDIKIAEAEQFIGDVEK